LESALGLSRPTVARYLQALEEIFAVRSVKRTSSPAGWRRLVRMAAGQGRTLATWIGSRSSRSFRFTARRIEVLRTAAEQLKIAVPDGRIVVAGLVSRLRRDPGEGAVRPR
jgi:predicted ArsR family transcriptional regulator